MMRSKKINGKYTYKERIIEEENIVDLDCPELERTGPYIPEIYIANSTFIVMIDMVKEIFEKSGLTGIKNIKKVIMKKIIDINWTEWDVNKEAKFYPKSGEPEDYILKYKNNEKLKESMPIVWCTEIQNESYTLKIISSENNNEKYIASKVPDKDVSMPENMLYIIVSEDFKNILENNNIGTIQFDKIEIGK